MFQGLFLTFKTLKSQYLDLDSQSSIYFVRDNGVGFAMEKYGDLFQPFSRLHSTEDFSGTGLGLSITQRIIELHHGQIWAESGVNKGTSFYFTLNI